MQAYVKAILQGAKLDPALDLRLLSVHSTFCQLSVSIKSFANSNAFQSKSYAKRIGAIVMSFEIFIENTISKY